MGLIGNLVVKLVLKRAIRQSAKKANSCEQELFEQMDTNPEIKQNCTDSLLSVVKPLIQAALIEFKEKTCDRVDVTIRKDFKCVVSNNGKGIDGTVLKDTAFSAFELMNSNDEACGNFITAVFEGQNEEESPNKIDEAFNEMYDENTIIGNLKKVMLGAGGYCEITSNHDGEKFVKLYDAHVILPSKFRNKGKTSDTGLSVVFNETINVFKKLSFGFDEIVNCADTVAKENPGFTIVVSDERNNQQKLFRC